uniref:Uncharacterized protein n=1 Tax=Cucumis melo TaxID=3656 RepID=A0A9I9EN10_CUCME
MIKISHRKLKCPKNQKFCISLVIFLPMDFLTNFISTSFFQFHLEGLYLSLLSQSPQSLVWKICYFCSQSWVHVWSCVLPILTNPLRRQQMENEKPPLNPTTTYLPTHSPSQNCFKI